MWKLILLLVGLLTVVLLGLSLVDMAGGDEISARADLLGVPSGGEGYARAIAARNWQFPRDYGAHPDFQTEWWYYTGNLADEEGRRFGYQFTIFRRAIAPAPARADSASEWRSNQVYMAHFTVTDVEGGAFYQSQRFSRGGANLAGAETDPLYHVWLEDWSATAQDAAAAYTRIQAATPEAAIDLRLEQVKPPALQGDGGLSPKGGGAGNASYYYSLSRLLTGGQITIGDRVYRVSGASWMDHEFGTSALGENAVGWDWFGLHLDDDRELMLGRIRLAGGGSESVFGGLYVLPDGSTRRIAHDDFTLAVTDTWLSPHTGAVYPAGWEVRVDIGESEPLSLALTPLLADQELHEGIPYWEGAVRITGDATGYGYAELTGYAGTMNGRF